MKASQLILFVFLFPASIFCQESKNHARTLEFGNLDTVTTIDNYDLFPVYGRNFNADSFKINYYVPISKQLTLNEKIYLLAQYISAYHFRGLPIEVLSIQEQNSKTTVIVNLKEDSRTKNSQFYWGWKNGYFQGSSEGGETTICLKESFLQRKYKGKWINVVKFYYEGKPIKDTWDHINLYGELKR